MNKVIHYCWFGGNPLPELAIKCIESWKKYFPDYEIKEWNESNFDVHCIPYVEEAYHQKKWAFVSDYARFWILYNYGGVYFDTDVEVIKSFDKILCKGAFMGCEPTIHGKNKNIAVNAGLGIASEAGLEIYKEILEMYSKINFLKSDGTMDLTTVVDRITAILVQKGFDTNNNKVQLIDQINIYPCDYFCPMDYSTGKITLTENTHSIHHYTSSWHSPKEEYTTKLRYRITKFLPRKMAGQVAFLISNIKFEGIKYTLNLLIKKIHNR